MPGASTIDASIHAHVDKAGAADLRGRATTALRDAREACGPVSRVNDWPVSRVTHWLVAAVFLAVLAIGLGIGHLPLERATWGVLHGWHKALGTPILVHGP